MHFSACLAAGEIALLAHRLPVGDGGFADHEAAVNLAPQGRLAQLNLLDALFMGVARINPRATEANLTRTMSAVRNQRACW
ncbi:MAG: hypothetical protein JO151_10100 [Verrucomicrobia bacterium]|nr:hypothetical protein [Verrucomicrobiota bacterium]